VTWRVFRAQGHTEFTVHLEPSCYRELEGSRIETVQRSVRRKTENEQPDSTSAIPRTHHSEAGPGQDLARRVTNTVTDLISSYRTVEFKW
jgi:hypothetical protein